MSIEVYNEAKQNIGIGFNMAAHVARVNDHIKDTDNPHKVTAEQVGAAPISSINSITNKIGKLEDVLQQILDIIQSGSLPSTTVEQIEDLIVSYFEDKTAGEVEGE